MSQEYSMLGFFVIVILYATVGLLAAAGSISITRKLFGPRAEEAFYGVFLILVAAFYLAFVAYFENPAAWRAETAAVVVFAVIGLFGVRLPIALVIGYPLHGVWDLLHELFAQGAFSAFEPGQLTAIPLAYGVFCAAFDVGIAAYAYAQRVEWDAAWTAQPQPETETEPETETTPPA